MQHKMGVNRKGDAIYIDGKSKIGEVRGSLIVVYDQVADSTFDMVNSMYGDIYLVIRLKEYNKRNQEVI